MTEQVQRKFRLGKKEQEVINFLKAHPEGVWKEDVIREFSWASRYDGVVSKRLYRLQKKGYIEIRTEINPETGRTKQRVYLKE